MGEDAFEPAIEATDVVTEFRRRFPDENRQYAIIAQQIRNSQGRFPVRGEIHQPDVWLKGACVPNSHDIPWLSKILESVDTTAGKWEVEADQTDPNRICLFQFRRDIPLSSHLKTLGVPDNEEHIPAWNRAKDFLQKNANQFGIEQD